MSNLNACLRILLVIFTWVCSSFIGDAYNGHPSGALEMCVAIGSIVLTLLAALFAVWPGNSGSKL